MIDRVEKDQFRNEYGIQCRRVFPKQTTSTPFGATWCVVEPNGSTDPHSHHEGETFFILEGTGLMTVGNETSQVQKGDVVYIPKHENHVLKNLSQDRELNFLSVWWEDEVTK